MTLLQQFIDNHTKQIEPLEVSSNLAWWQLAVTGDERYAEQLKESRIALRKIYTSSEDYQYLLSLSESSDPILNRQRVLLLHSYQENQISSEMIEQMVKLEADIESTYTNFRPNVKGVPLSNNDLKKVLAESKDSEERKEAWEGSKVIGEQVEKQIYQLITLRNTSAQKAGFSDYYSMRLELQELDQNRLFELLNQLDQLTTPHWQHYKTHLDQKLAENYGIMPSELCPWHYHDPFFQEAPSHDLKLDQYYQGKDLVEINRAFYEAIGLPVDDILKRSDLDEREKKNQHAFCISINRKEDVRILCNLRDNKYWMSTLLHELGHAVYDKFIDPNLPFVLRTPAHTSTTEAIAMLFGRLSDDGEFLQHYCNIDVLTAEHINRQSQQQTAQALLVFARWVLVMTHFERAMYQQPGIDLNKFWWDCVEQFQWIKRVPHRNKPDWASKLHLACAPVYYQNYILGEMTASQLMHHLKCAMKTENTNFLTSPKAGAWLKTLLFQQGALRPWEQALQYATGEVLMPKYFSVDLGTVK